MRFRLVAIVVIICAGNSVLAQNLLSNGGFDPPVVQWFITAPSPGQPITGTVSWQPLDALRAANSGSALVKKVLSGNVDAALAQCVAVDEGKLYDVGARILIQSGQSPTSLARVGIAFYESRDCTGSALTPASNYLSETYSGGGDFDALATHVGAPAGAKGALVELKVTDSQVPSAQVEVYFDDVIFAPTGGCVPISRAGSGTLCLESGRFKATATFAASATDSKARAQVVQLTRDSGYFWFFAPDNVEVTIKVLNACTVNGRHWVFAAGMTNVNVVITVTDTQTGAVKTYTNPLNTPFAPILSVDAFACP